MRAASELKSSLIGIVDDDSAVRESISSLLRSAGFRTAVFSSAVDFLDSEELKCAACLILDVMMPCMNGIDLQVRLAEIRPRMPIIFATAYPDEMMRQRALDNGAVAFLQKPFGDEVLFAAMRTALAD
jgi:FixJ family two-component response regulator